MRKITNNAKWGKIAMLFNVLILISFIFSMVLIMKFDKVNVKLVENEPSYEKGLEKIQEVEKPRRQAIAEMEHYQEKIDKFQKEAAGKPLTKELANEINIANDALKIRTNDLKRVDSVIHVEQVLFEPIQKVYNDYKTQTEEANHNFMIGFYITLCLFIAKIIIFGYLNLLSLKNLRVSSPWMSKSTAPFWGLVAWIIPGYNFIKPYVVFSEIWSETSYILKDREIIAKETKEENDEFYIGLWWGLFLIATLVMSWILYSTFFSTGAMFTKIPHSGATIIAVIVWFLYLCLDTFLLRKFNKMSQILFANQSKL
jgi:hypothetical protein